MLCNTHFGAVFELAIVAAVHFFLECNRTCGSGKNRIIFCAASVCARPESGAALANNYHAALCFFAAIELNAQALSLGIAQVSC